MSRLFKRFKLKIKNFIPTHILICYLIYDIDNAVDSLQSNIQQAAFTTPRIYNTRPKEKILEYILDKIHEKRRLRKLWQNERTLLNKNFQNRATKNSKETLNMKKTYHSITTLKTLPQMKR